jgi:hypothetical protein
MRPASHTPAAFPGQPPRVSPMSEQYDEIAELYHETIEALP